MSAPPVLAAASFDILPPCLSAFKQPTEKALVSESTPSQLVFPNEFPYEFAFTSPEDLTETESETNEDEDDFLAGLTRRLALFTQRLPSPPPSVAADKAEVSSTESTRIGLGSCTVTGNKSPNGPFSQTLSPPETPVRRDDSVKAAKTKVSNFFAKPNSRPNPKPNSSVSFPQNAAFYNYHYYYYYWWLRQTQPALDTYRYPVGGVFAAPTAVKPCAGTGVFTGPTAVKQPSAGTGVFFPQNCTNPCDSRKRPGKCVKSTKVAQTQHSKTEKLPGGCQSSSQGRLSAGGSKLDRGTKSEVTGGSLKEERNLPQEWIY